MAGSAAMLSVVRRKYLSQVERWDEAAGQRVYLVSQASRPSRIASSIASLSGDEALWIPTILAVAVVQALLRNTADAAAMNDLLLDVMMCTIVEMALKFCARRARPGYAKQGSFYILPGEWWSFPSGHSMRGAYLARQFALSPTVAAVSPVPLVFLACWPPLVAWARVAKGKHFPLDVVVGLAVGLAAADVRAATPQGAWAAVRIAMGCVMQLQLAASARRPELRLTGFHAHLFLQLVYWIVVGTSLEPPLSLPLSLGLGAALSAVGWLAGAQVPASAAWAFRPEPAGAAKREQ